VRVHLVDGTYELFRYFFALPSHLNRDGQEVSATRGVVGSMLGLLEDGATHVGVATDHVVESFRNDLWEGYKTSDGIEAELLSQFPLLEDALEAAGFAVWRMIETEADDGMATGAALAAADPRVKQVLICTPDKDLAQCVSGNSIVQLDRRKEVTYDEKGVMEKFGVMPSSIPDYLALVGDAADGFPGLPGWGAKSAAALLSHYGHIEEIPDDPRRWQVKVRGAAKLAGTLAEHRDLAMLFRRIATVVTDTPEVGPVDSWRWSGPREEFEEICDYLDAPALPARATRLAGQRA
jgi:5'-3' exonuclease